jgi:hypothetical protein
VRLYDPYGQRGRATLKTRLPFAAAYESNIMEDDLRQVDVFTETCDAGDQWHCVSIDYRASEIVCLHLR